MKISVTRPEGPGCWVIYDNDQSDTTHFVWKKAEPKKPLGQQKDE